jgi:hypothetical protein
VEPLRLQCPDGMTRKRSELGGLVPSIGHHAL